MNADEIRQHGITGYSTGDNRAIVSCMEEIAALLAELRDSTIRIAECLEEAHK